jgi:hypothetical protein
MDWIPAEALTRDSIGELITVQVDDETTFKGRLDRFTIDSGEVTTIVRDWGQVPMRTSMSCTVQLTLSGIGPMTVPGAAKVTPRFDTRAGMCSRTSVI